MSRTGGVLSETELLEIRILADRIGMDDRIKQQFDARVDILNAIAENQTAKITPLSAKDKDYDVRIEWMNTCDIKTQEVENCTFCDNEVSTNTEDKKLTLSQEVCFSVDEAKYRDNDFDFQEAIAKAFLKGQKELAEWLAAIAVARVDSFKGVNMLGTTGKGVVAGAETYIAAPYWDASLIAYFNRVGIINKFTNPWFLSGNNLYEQMLIARYNGLNGEGKGNAAMYNSLRMYFDLFNIDTVLSPDLKTFMISDGAMAMGFKNYMTASEAAPWKSFTEWRWQIPALHIPGANLDVHYTNECNEANGFYTHKFKMILRGDIWVNPEGCQEGNTGVLSFTCGTNPTP